MSTISRGPVRNRPISPSHIPPSYPLPEPYVALLPYLRVLISHSASAKPISICARLFRPGTGHGPHLCLRSRMYTCYYCCARVRAFVGRTAASIFFSKWLLRSQANAVRADSSAVPSVPYRPSSGRPSWICSSCHSVRSISYAFSPQHAVEPALLGFAQLAQAQVHPLSTASVQPALSLPCHFHGGAHPFVSNSFPYTLASL